MCIGFLPVLVMPLHNWYFGHAFVLLSGNACLPGTCCHDADGHFIRPCRAGTARILAGPNVQQASSQIVSWLSQPSERAVSIPFNAVAAVIVFYVTLRGRDFDPWLRLIGAAVLAEFVVDFIYAPTPRYYFEMWLLSAVIVAVFIEHRLPAWMDKHGWIGAKRVLERSIGYRPAQVT